MTEFVEVKTSELTGYALDWAVARVEGLNAAIFPDAPHYVFIDWPGCGCGPYHPCMSWAQGGPLIQKYHMDFCCEHPETIGAALCDENGMYIDDRMMFGKTHLTAACRAIVAAKLGDTVQIPAELVKS